MARILVVEDKDSLRALLARVLTPAHEVETVADGRAAMHQLDTTEFDLVLTDVRLPEADGFTVLAHCRARHPNTEVILMTAFANVNAAVAAVKAGAYDYLAKPFEPDELVLKVERALERRALRARADAAEHALRTRDGSPDMLGDSAAMRQVRRLIERVADLDVTVLVTGESGTGKELVARAIHEGSRRRASPFVAVNCGAMPEALMESELFGHVRGAFTGATGARDGLIAEAGDGTLFLDEIGDLPLDVQVKLNRVLQERVVRRVGETRERPIQARIVAATHRDLPALVAEGRFREDLYFRLLVYPIHLPRLTERGDDVFQLAHHFRQRAAERFRRPVTGFSPEALRILLAHHWPGNVRELAHTVERAVILAEGTQITPAELTSGAATAGRPLPPPEVVGTYKDALEVARDHATRRYLDGLLTHTLGNVTRAAEIAGVERESLHRLLRKAGLDAASYRGEEG